MERRRGHLAETPPKRRRDRVDSVRTAYWFEVVKFRTGLSSARQLEKRFEPGAFATSSLGVSYYKNKWGAYARGLHVPRSSLVDSVDAELSGTYAELNHVLFDILRLGADFASQIPRWIDRLDRSIRDLVYVKSTNLTKRFERRPCSRRVLNALERRPCLDSLAMLVILLYDARQANVTHSHREPPSWREICHKICTMMLVISLEPPIAPVARHLYALVCERIFSPLAHDDAVRLDWQDVDFEEDCLILHIASRQYERGTGVVPTSQAKRLGNLVFLLYGGAGFDVWFALQPMFVPIEKRSSANDPDYVFLDWHRKLRRLARRVLLKGGAIPASAFVSLVSEQQNWRRLVDGPDSSGE